MIYIISPHIDDAILSIGGLVHKLISSNKTVNIKYVFTISNWYNPHAISGRKYTGDTEEMTLIRAAEEKRVSEMLRYTYNLLNYPDNPLRDKASDVQLMGRIEEDIKSNVHKKDTLFFPLGIDHDDHILLRNLGFKMLGEGYSILFYEDLPYAGFANYDYREVHKIFESKNLTSVCTAIHLPTKVQAIKLYDSQMSNSWIKDIINYSYSLTENTFHERFWKPKHVFIDFL